MNKKDLDLVTDWCIKCMDDPLSFVEEGFDWGRGELIGFDGPDKWQIEILTSVKERLLTINQAIQIAVASGHGIGKLLPYSSIIDTPTGKMVWGDIKVGDAVFGADGKPTKVIQCLHYKNVPMYRVRFDDGSFCDVSSGHLWNVRGRQERRNGLTSWRTMETIDIVKNGVQRSNGVATAKQWEIPIQGAAEFPAKETGIHPYLMGVWLGDGSKGSPMYTKPYPEIKEKVESFGYKAVLRKDNKTVWIYDIADKFKSGVFLCRSSERYIPDEYKYNSVENRMHLLCGLLDTDGEANKSGSIGYSSTSKQLADDVLWLARSLGCKAMMQPTTKLGWYYDADGNKVECRDCCRVTINAPFNPFTIKHRKENYKPSEHRYLTRWIDAIEPIPNADGMCITVENPDGLYLANDFIVTHNSALVSWLILWAISTRIDTKGVVTANTENQLKLKTWAELAKWHRLCLTKELFECSATSLYSKDKNHEKTWRIDMVPWSENNTEAFAGLHNQGRRILLIYDEASAIPNVIWEVSEGALTDANTEIIWCCFGNPTRNTGRFKDCFGKYRKRWITHNIDSRTCKMTNKEQLNKWVEDYGEDSDFCKVRIRGMFPSMSAKQFIPIEYVDRAYGRELRPEQFNFAPKIIGCDPAWEGTDNMEIVLRQGLYSRLLRTIPKNDNDVEIANILANLEDEHHADAVIIDAGYGTGIYSAGKTMGRRKWYAIWFSGKSPDPGCLNMRAYMWKQMRDWLREGGVIAKDQELYDDLIGPETIARVDGKIQLEAKKDMKKRGLPSPNKGDALAITFAVNIRSQTDPRGFYQQVNTKARTKYNPFKRVI